MLSGLRVLLLGWLALAWIAPVAAQSGASHDDSAALLARAIRPWTGDLDGMVERGMVRIATADNPIFFSYDGGREIGLVVETAREFEAFLRKKLGEPVDVILMPFPRDWLLPAVNEGRADIAIANLTITEARSKLVAFSNPTNSGIDELVVTGPDLGPIDDFEDLLEAGLYLRPSSSYYGHVQDLNAARLRASRTPIPLIDADENLEDHDLLEMVNAGIVPAIVVDSHKAALWAQVFDDITVNDTVAVNQGGETGWALRRENDRLLAIVNEFVETIRQGTLLGNILVERYLGSADWIEDIRKDEVLEDYERISEVIETYAFEYDFDWLMILAQAYQESKLDHDRISPSGAVGIMQILPTTAADPNVLISDISQLENNVHAGVKYMRFLRDRYFSEPGIDLLDSILLSFAAYNAGPANIIDARQKAAGMGLDPDVWFANVETAAARTVSREPVTYVRNIYKYFIAYKLARAIKADRAAAATVIEAAQ